MVESINLTIDKNKEKVGQADPFVAPAPDNIPDMIPLGAATAESKPDTTDLGKIVTAGERVHKWGTYLSVDWLFNAATGVSFAYWGKYTDLGKKIWSEPLTKGFTKLLQPLIKDPVLLEKSVGKGNMFMSIIAGGMFTIPPLMMLENNKTKKSITQFFDKLIYGKDKVENDPKFKAAYEEIENAPKKDFTSGMTSRFVALSPLLAMVLIPATQRVSNKVYFNHVEHASGVVAKKIGFSAEKTFKGISAAEAKERWKFIHESIAMDFGLGIPYALLHAFFYNMFAGKKSKGGKDKTAATEAHADTHGHSAETVLAPVESPTAAETAPCAADVRKWADIKQPSDKLKPAAYVMDKASNNFVDKIGDKISAEPQIV